MYLLEILVISPHLDNSEISVGGTIAISLRQNLHVGVSTVRQTQQLIDSKLGEGSNFNFNGAVIFESGDTRIGGTLAVVVFAVTLLRWQLSAR